MIISFSGLDGSGKSTHIRMTAAFLGGLGNQPKVIEVYNISSFSIMGRLLNLFSRQQARRLVNAQFRIGDTISTERKILSYIRKWSLFLDILNFDIFVKLPAWYQKRHVICDRYFYDAVIQLYYLEMCSKNFYEKMLMRIPAPDIPIFILVEPKVAIARKFEYDEGYFVRKSRLYRDAAVQRNCFEVVESEELDKTQKQIEKIITTHLYDL